MKITHCKTNHIENPIGFDMSHVVLTWVAEDTTSSSQKNARIILAKDEFLKEVLLNTGKRDDIDSRGYKVDIELSPYTRYYWKVEVEGDMDSAVSEVQFFETGKMYDEWQAQWISPPWNDTSINPYMRKTFSAHKKIASARAYIIGLGLYEMEINGKRVGNERLTPYCNAYDAWLQYQTYDVSDFIMEGKNTVGALLGNGWAKGPFGTFGDLNSPYIHDFTLLCEIRITYADGSSDLIISDDTWKCHETPILEDTLYDGESYDANKEIQGWSTSEYNDENWELVKLYKPEKLGPVVDRMSPPVVVKESVKPIELIRTPKGELVLDMGQNMVGWLRFRINEPKGTRIKISHGEVLQDGNFYRDNLREAKQEYIYISDGIEKVIEPHFTFYGFRYAKLEGFTKQIELEDFTGCVVYSDLDTTGHIETSDPIVNRLFLNALWGQKGNFLDVPTDCPQRDERMGWTGDAQVFSGTASYNMDSYAFYSKFLRDLYEEQKLAGGMVPSVVPTFNQTKQKESSFAGGGACAWSDAATVIPWEVYLHTGDSTILTQQYQSMKDWVDWIIKRDQESGDKKLWTVGFHFGDWLALDGPVEGGVLGGTDTGLLASAYYYLSMNILAKSAKVIGKDDDAVFYAKRSEEVKKAIQDEYFSKNGRSTILTQTAHVIALQFDLLDDTGKTRILKDLKDLLRKNNMHLSTGFIGTPFLCRSLSDYGDSDSAYQIFFQEDYPSWLYEVLMGATTIWERWNSILPDGKISGTGMNSLNHYAYGSIVEWMYRNMCGIKPVEYEPGFKSFIIEPMIYGKLFYAKASLDSAMGKIRSSWKRDENDHISIEVEVPFNTQAKLILPYAKLDGIIGLNEDMVATQVEKMVHVTLSSGIYSFEYESTKDYRLVYSLQSSIEELKTNKNTRAILHKYLPHLLEEDGSVGGMKLPYSIDDIVCSGDGFMLGLMLRGADVKAMNKELMEVEYAIRSV